MLKVAENFYILSDDPSSWIPEISHIFSEKFPELTEFGIEIKINKINPEIGFGIGTITVFSDVDEVHIPIIIRDKKLAPLDVFEYKKVYYPLKSSKVINILYAGKLGTPIAPVPVERAGHPTMIGELVPPPYGLGPRGEYYTEVRQLSKPASSLFLSISKSIFSEQLKQAYDKFIKIAQTLSGSLVDFVRKELERLFSLSGSIISAKSYLTNEIRRVRRNVFLIKKVGPDAYQITFTTQGQVFPFNTITVGSNGIIKLLTALKYDIPAAFTDLDSGKVIYFSPSENQALVPIILEKINGQIVDKPGRYVFVTANGRIIRGLVIKNLFGGWMLWSDPYALADTLYGVKESDFVDKTPYNRECSPGQTVLIRVISDDGSNSIGFGPIKVFRVLSKRASCQLPAVTRLDNSEFSKLVGNVITISGKLGDYPISVNINTQSEDSDKPISLCKKESGEIEITLNTPNVDILPVTYEVTLPENEQEFYDYLSLFKRPVNVEFLGDGTYLISSGSDRYNIPDSDYLVLSLISLSIPKESAMKIASSLEKTRKLTLLGPQIINKKEFILEKSAMDKLKTILGIDDNLIKAAIAAREGLTLDTVFSLNLINPSNIQKFIENVPLLRETVSYLAKLLMFTRLGFKELPEEELTYLIKKLDEIADKLESLSIIYRSRVTV